VAEAFLRISNERIAVLIGPKGKAKKEIELKTKTRISIESETGEIQLHGEDGEKLHRAEQIVQAIGRGFPPKKAMFLLGDNIVLSVLKLRDIVGKSEKTISQKKSRIIGRQGETRNRIEKETGTSISIYGSTISIIGKFEETDNAEEIIMRIIDGANIPTAFEMFKEKKMRQQKFEL